MNKILNTLFWGNTIREWIIAVSIAAGLILVLQIFRRSVLLGLRRWATKSNNKVDDFFISALERSFLPVLYLAAVYTGLSYLQFSVRVNQVIRIALLVAGTFYVLRLLTFVVEYFIYGFIQTQENSDVKKKQARGIIVVLNVLLWVFGFVFLIDNLGYNVTTVIAGLGVGGIAIALAAQAILGDLFSYFVIFFDKPFEIGDFITVDDKMGTIEYVGIKTTRVRALSGEQLIFSNTNLTSARVHNFKRLERRRAVFSFAVHFETPANILRKIPDLVKNIIKSQPTVEFDRGHFSTFGQFSFNFEFVYFVTTPDYNLYMDRQQEINFLILESFEREGISLAFPAQTISWGKDGEKK